MIRGVYCPNCHNTGDWQLVKVVSCFTLFYIPIIPYHFEYFLICPVCGMGRKLTKAQFLQLKDGNTEGIIDRQPQFSQQAVQSSQNPAATEIGTDSRPFVFQIEKVISQPDGRVTLGGRARQGCAAVGDGLTYTDKTQIPYFKCFIDEIANKDGKTEKAFSDAAGNAPYGLTVSGRNASEFTIGNYMIDRK